MPHRDVKTHHGATFMLLDRAVRERAEQSEQSEQSGMARRRAGLPEP
jgi:hypothetical protein